MKTTKLKKFAQQARTTLIDTVNTKLAFVLADGSSARRENPKAVKKLEDEIVSTSEEQVVEKVAYIWFNRFIALRFMDVNRYTKLGIVSPEEGQSQPVILSDAKMGHVDDSLVSDSVKEKVLALLENRTPSQDPQGEAYKLLVVSACNYYSHAMPFLFEKIADYTELLMPDDLLSGTSILNAVREAMTPDVCEDVEVIGWLYQFYISEKKDKVFEGIKKNKKVTPENIPAATQLFTPHWIVQYMVENSLGRLWMLNNPDSKLKMDYYIKPESVEDDYLKIEKPQDLKICDPACGSGHILVYAFDLLFEIYKEAGFTDDDTIIENILKHNLYGIEIDERAAELAAFALAMKAASRSGSKRRFFRNPIEVNICKLEVIKFDDEEINSYMDAVGRDLFTSDLQTTLKQFEEADNFGSLIQPAVKDVTVTLQTLKEKDVSHDLFLAPTHEKVLQVLEQADYLSQKYHVVVANPPYMGKKGLNSRLGVFLKDNFEDVKSDLFSAFVIRCSRLGIRNANIGIMSPNVWMYISSYEKLRHFILKTKTLTSLVELPLSGFQGATVQICSYTFINYHDPSLKGSFIRLVDFKGADKEMAIYTKEAIKNKDNTYFYQVASRNFEKISGYPIAYWISNKLINLFQNEKIGDISEPKQGMATTDNNRFVRHWNEINFTKIGFNYKSREEASNSLKKWFPFNKGGEYRKWYGNDFFVVNYENDGSELREVVQNKYSKASYAKDFTKAKWDKLIDVWVLKNKQFYFFEGITWGKISSSYFSVRFVPSGFIFSDAGMKVFIDHGKIKYLTAFLNSNLIGKLIQVISPTLNYEQGSIKSLPIILDIDFEIKKKIDSLASDSILISKGEWDSRETSWDFTRNELIKNKTCHKIGTAYSNYCTYWKEKFFILHENEEKLNKLFMDIYELQDELTSDVELKDITILKNETRIVDDELDFQSDEIIKQFISYGVGVLFGRYSLDSDGLLIADISQDIPTDISFEIDNDNVIPILEGDWFTDDISERFLQFVKVTFGEEHYEENIQFIEDAIGKSIRKYFVKDFYADHIKRYKKRPIYWLFSSPKGSFQALIYMHRYKSDTVSVILNDYLRDYITKLEATKDNLEAVGISASASKSEKIKAIKEIEKIKKMIIELVDYEKDIMYPLATQKIEIDLDDGVKHNYPLFGKALKKVTGLS